MIALYRQCFAHVGAERLADGVGLFAAVEYGYATYCSGQCAEESRNVKGSEEADYQYAYFFAVGDESFRSFLPLQLPNP